MAIAKYDTLRAELYLEPVDGSLLDELEYDKCRVSNKRLGVAKWHESSPTRVSPHLPSRGAVPVVPVASSAGAQQLLRHF